MNSSPPPRTLPVLLSFVDTEARYRFVDDAYAEWFATPPAEILGRRVADVVGEAAWESLRPHIEAALGGEKVSFEQVIPYAGAGERHVSVDYIPRRATEGGEVEGFYAIVRDVTERKALEGDLARAQRMEAVGTLASAVAHDFRNVLMAIHGMACVVRDAIEPNHTAQRPLAEIVQAASSGSSAVRHLLAFARPSLAESVAVSVDDAVRSTYEMLGRLLPSDVTLQLDLGAPDAVVLCAPGQIEQVVMNLGLNARDAMPSGGEVVLRTRCERLGPADVDGHHHALPPGPYVTLTVSDTGVGMDAETLGQVLEPFFSTKEDGTGLGLFGAHRMARHCGGSLEVHSLPGEGTTVEMRLPRAEGAEPVVGAEPPARRLQPVAVLVLEDDALIRLAVRHYLEKHGFRVFEADDERSATAALREHPEIGLAVVDVTLGRVRGPVVVERMATSVRAVPVVYVSAYPKRMLVEDGHVREDAIALEKPFGETELLDAAARALRPMPAALRTP